MHPSTPFIAALLLSATSAKYHTVKTTIPWVGKTVTTTTLPQCSGTVTVVVETPLKGAVCTKTPAYPTSPYPTTRSATKTTKKVTTSSKQTTSTVSTTSTPSTTTTETTGTTSGAIGLPTPSTGACLVNPLCAAQGFNLDYYFNDLGQYSNGESGVLSNYYIVDELSPLASTLTNISFFPTDEPMNLPPPIYPNASLAPPNNFYYPGYMRIITGDLTVDGNNYTLVYSGFYKAPVTGTYQLCSGSDNENDVYFGDGNAFSCKTGLPPNSANPVLLTNLAQQCIGVEMIKGRYYPYRSVMGNFGGVSSLDFSIVPPTGTLDLSRNKNDNSGFVYPVECGIFLDPNLPGPTIPAGAPTITAGAR